MTRSTNADDDDCVPCPEGMYNLDGSWYRDGLQTGFDAFCLSCPKGFTCHKNVVKNSAGYWGIVVSRTIYPKINGKPCWNSHIELVEPNDTAVNACRNRTEIPDGTVCANRGRPDHEAYCSYDVDDGACARCSIPKHFSSTKLNLSQVESHQCQEGACLETLQGGLGQITPGFNWGRHGEARPQQVQELSNNVYLRPAGIISNCSSNRTGPKCAFCEPGWALDGGICVECDEHRNQIGLIVIGIFAAFIILALWLRGYRYVFTNAQHRLPHRLYDWVRDTPRVFCCDIVRRAGTEFSKAYDNGSITQYGKIVWANVQVCSFSDMHQNLEYATRAHTCN